MVSALNRVLGPLATRLRQVVGRGVLRLVNDAGGIQDLQLGLLADEYVDRVPRFQSYGFSSVPLPGAEAIVVAPGGSRSNLVAIAVEDSRYRPRNHAAGEVLLFTDEGDTIVLKRGRIVEVNAGTKVKITAPSVEVVASTGVLLTTPTVTVTGNLVVNGTISGAGGISSAGDVSDSAGSMAEMRTTYNSHTHVDPQGGATAVPTQLMT